MRENAPNEGKSIFQMLWDGLGHRKHQETSYDEGRYKIQAKPREETKLDIKSIKPLIQKTLQEELEKRTVGTPAKHEGEDELIEKLKKDRSLRYYIKEILKERGIPFEE